MTFREELSRLVKGMYTIYNFVLYLRGLWLGLRFFKELGSRQHYVNQYFLCLAKPSLDPLFFDYIHIGYLTLTFSDIHYYSDKETNMVTNPPMYFLFTCFCGFFLLYYISFLI